MTNEEKKYLQYAKREAEWIHACVRGDLVRPSDDEGPVLVMLENGVRQVDVNGVIYKEGDEEHDLGGLEQYDLYEYIADNVYDVTYLVDSEKKYRSVRLLIAGGGPTAYLNTETGRAEVQGAAASACYPLDGSVVNALDDYYTETYN